MEKINNIPSKEDIERIIKLYNIWKKTNMMKDSTTFIQEYFNVEK